MIIIEDNLHLRCQINENICLHGNACSLNHLDVSGVTDMGMLFYRKTFKGDISEWDVSSVTNMGAMFRACPFNGDISRWDVSKVTWMHEMFRCSGFSGGIKNWETAQVISMRSMFRDSSFRGDISTWKVSDKCAIYSMLEGSEHAQKDANISYLKRQYFNRLPIDGIPEVVSSEVSAYLKKLLL